MSKLDGILEQIQSVLEQTFELPVWYGRTFKSKLDYNYYYQVHIIMENYIPEGFEQKVIKAIQDNTRLKLTDQSMQFNYITKNNTDMVVEMLTLEFTRAFKGCDLDG